MVSAKEASKIVLAKYVGSKIMGCFDVGTKYVFSLCPKGWDPREIMDGLFAVDKNSKALSEYSPFMEKDKWDKRTKVDLGE